MRQEDTKNCKIIPKRQKSVCKGQHLLCDQTFPEHMTLVWGHDLIMCLVWTRIVRSSGLVFWLLPQFLLVVFKFCEATYSQTYPQWSSVLILYLRISSQKGCPRPVRCFNWGPSLISSCNFGTLQLIGADLLVRYRRIGSLAFSCRKELQGRVNNGQAR